MSDQHGGPEPPDQDTQGSSFSRRMGAPPPPRVGNPDSGDGDGGDGDDDGMLRMSFLEHLEELRARLIAMLKGIGIAYLICVWFSEPIWRWIQVPLQLAVHKFKGEVIASAPMEMFMVLWVWTPVLATIYLAAPWILYQVWAFISPGLYPRERKWAAPFILITVGLFVTGGLFGYYVALPFGLPFLLGLGQNVDVKPFITIENFFELFVNVILGVSVLFEMPVVVFILTLLRITTPGFLMNHSRYAILIIVILAAIITPTPDPFNLALFSVPMILLFFLGVFASYLLVLHREGQKFPWKAFWIWVLSIVALIAAILAVAVIQYGFKLVPYSPFLIK